MGLDDGKHNPIIRPDGGGVPKRDTGSIRLGIARVHLS